jgi:hypothetical protein
MGYRPDLGMHRNHQRNKMKNLFALLFALAFGLSAHAGGYDYSGNELTRNMNEGSTWGGGNASGYIWGVADMLLFQEEICIAEGVTRRQLSDVVMKFVQNNPAQRHKDAVLLAAAALIDAFPCKKKPKGSSS